MGEIIEDWQKEDVPTDDQNMEAGYRAQCLSKSNMTYSKEDSM